MQRSNLVRRAQSLLPCDDPDDLSSSSSSSSDSDDTKNGYAYKPLNALTLQSQQVLQSPRVQQVLQSPQVQLLLRKANLVMLLFGITFVLLYMNAGYQTQSLAEQVSALQSENNGLRQSLKVTALEYENKGLRQGLEVAQHQGAKALAPVKGVAALAAKAAAARTPAFTTTTNKAVAVSAPSTSVSTANKSGLEPMACQDFIDRVKSGTYPVAVKDPNMKKGRFTRRTITEHPFWISVHHEKFDPTRWTIYQKGRYYEHSLGKIWTDILRQATPGSRVLDVGGNIGYYSLVSASMGEFKIDSFEPNLKNALRFCESLVMNSWKNEQEHAVDTDPAAVGKPSVNIWPAGVSDTTGTLQFFESYGNPGAGRFGTQNSKRTDSSSLPVTTLDVFAEERGWFETRPEIAIMKVDVERHEANVLVGAEKLLKSGMVKNIFTETSLEDPERRPIEAAALELLVTAGYKLVGQGGWSGPGKEVIWANDENLVKNIFNSIEEGKKEYLNLWWSL